MKRIAVAATLVAAALVLAGGALSGASDPKAAELGRELAAMKADTPPEQVYDLFNRFCMANFGAEKEPLVYDLCGKTLQVNPGGDWVHPSETSACIAWETNLPAMGTVEYGTTAQYGRTTAPAERFFYIHVVYVTGLDPDAEYHYRLVSTDERGNAVRSEDRTFRTGAPAGALHVPGDLPGPPYVLDKADTTYVLTQDITSPAGGIEVKAEGVTLDLNGHTVAYHTKDFPTDVFTDKWASYDKNGPMGIRNWGGSNFKLFNGTVLQGEGNNAGNDESTGFNPVYVRGCSKVEIAGVTVNYRSSQTTGMILRDSGEDQGIHHNVFLDRGCRIRNRHGAGVRSLDILGGKPDRRDFAVYRNLVKRTRQMGLPGANSLLHNETYTDSWSVNSFAMAVYKDDGVAGYNRIFGTGVNVQGFGWANKHSRIEGNFVHLVGIFTGKNRGAEGWGNQDSLNGLRVTQYDKGGQVRDDLLYKNNLVVIECHDGSQARGTEFFSDETITDLICKGATIKVTAADDKTSQVACVVTHGQADKADTCLPVVYEDCRLISNFCNVRMGDYYGKGSNHRFVRCKIERLGDDPRYHTFIVDGQYWSKRHVFLDCDFGPGTAYNDVLWKMTSNKSFYSIAWTLSLRTLPGAKVTVKDASGAVEFEGAAAADGTLAVPLTQVTIRPPAKLKCPSTERVEEVKTPHTVTFEKDGRAATRTVDMTKKQEIVVVF